MKAIKIFLAVFSFAVLSGCKKEYSFEDEVKCKIEEDVKNICADVNAKERTKALFNLISSNTNNSLRIKLYTKWGNDVLAAKMPMQTNDYLTLRRIIGRVKDRILTEVSWGLQDDCEGAKENVFDCDFQK